MRCHFQIVVSREDFEAMAASDALKNKQLTAPVRRWREFHGGGIAQEMKQIVALVFGLGLLCNALLFVPQALAVWRKKTDEGISLITFGGFSVLQAIGIVHGVYQHDPSLTLGMAASLLSCGTVTILTLFYRLKRLRTR